MFMHSVSILVRDTIVKNCMSTWISGVCQKLCNFSVMVDALGYSQKNRLGGNKF